MYKKTIILFITIALFFSCNNQEKKGKPMNEPEKSFAELKDLALKLGDIESYEILETAYLDYAPQEFIPIALEMANKYKYPKAFQDVYWKMCSQQGLSEDDELVKWNKWQKKERSFAFKYLILGAINGDNESIDVINNYYSISKPLNKLMITDSLLVSEFYDELIKLKIKKKSILVLPSFDIMENAGRSTDISICLESELSKQNTFNVITFPLLTLMGVPYQNVFDKKYCEKILKKVPADIIIMSKLDYNNILGNTDDDTWDYVIKIYNVLENNQFDSQVKAKNIAYKRVCDEIQKSINNLILEINKYKY